MPDSIQIAVCNQATVPLDFDLVKLVTALQAYVDSYIVPVWGINCAATLRIVSQPVTDGSWNFVFYDDADQPGALAYHTVDPTSHLPCAKVFVRTILEAGEIVSVGASHELVEMLVDPSCATVVKLANGTEYAYEAADPVEETHFPLLGFAMSNFVKPSYFVSDDAPEGTSFDVMGFLSHSFQILPGGYQSVLENGQWIEIFGSNKKKKHFHREDRRQHRSEYRKEQLAVKRASIVL